MLLNGFEESGRYVADDVDGYGVAALLVAVDVGADCPAVREALEAFAFCGRESSDAPVFDHAGS